MATKVAFVFGAIVAGLVIGFCVLCVVALALDFCWGLGVVPFGAPQLTFWQAWGLGGLLGLVGGVLTNSIRIEKK